ncbi:transcriptional regulator [Streptomyces sp. 7R007]
MTVVKATEPPRLPVRNKTEARERGWGGVSPMLTRLAAERATGVLVRERGTLHLADGLVVHAESPSAPGLDVLLTARGTLGADTWRQAVAETGGDRPRAGRALVAGGRLTAGALELCHLAALYDAAYFALAPSSTPGRFRYGGGDDHGGADRPGAVRPVPVAALERETLRRRDLLHRIWPDARADEAPLLRTHLPAAPALTRRQRAVLARVDGARTAPQIARELGHLAFHTLVDVRRLTAAGVLRTERDEPPPHPPPPPTGEPLPIDPHITLLKRLRDALEAL